MFGFRLIIVIKWSGNRFLPPAVILVRNKCIYRWIKRLLNGRVYEWSNGFLNKGRPASNRYKNYRYRLTVEIINYRKYLERISYIKNHINKGKKTIIDPYKQPNGKRT